MTAIQDPFVFAGLTALTGAVSALWLKLWAQGTKLEKLLADEAACQAEMKSLKADLDAKHRQNVILLRRIKEHTRLPDGPGDTTQPP